MLLVLICIALTSCDIVVNGGAGGYGQGGNGTGGANNGNPTAPSPTPTPSPTPAPTPAGGGPRTPDPLPGSILALPIYGEQAIATLQLSPVGHCLDFVYLDAAVDALRRFDTRWGYQCKDSACATVSMDRVAYHATAGADIAGALGVWTVDIISSACEAPGKTWIVDGYSSSLRWTGRGRF